MAESLEGWDAVRKADALIAYLKDVRRRYEDVELQNAVLEMKAQSLDDTLEALDDEMLEADDMGAVIDRRRTLQNEQAELRRIGAIKLEQCASALSWEVDECNREYPSHHTEVDR
jgi:hypothetical protein